MRPRVNFVYYLLTCVPYARRGRGWEAAFTPVRILGSGSGWEILAIALCPQINFLFTLCTGHISLFFASRSFVSNLPPTPPPPRQPLHTLDEIRFQNVASKLTLHGRHEFEPRRGLFLFVVFCFVFVCLFLHESFQNACGLALLAQLILALSQCLEGIVQTQWKPRIFQASLSLISVHLCNDPFFFSPPSPTKINRVQYQGKNKKLPKLSSFVICGFESQEVVKTICLVFWEEQVRIPSQRSLKFFIFPIFATSFIAVHTRIISYPRSEFSI